MPAAQPGHADAGDLEEGFTVTPTFMQDMLQRFKEQKLIHRRYAFAIILQVRLSVSSSLHTVLNQSFCHPDSFAVTRPSRSCCSTELYWADSLIAPCMSNSKKVNRPQQPGLTYWESTDRVLYFFCVGLPDTETAAILSGCACPKGHQNDSVRRCARPVL